MAVVFDRKPVASPNPATLPAQIRVSHVLAIDSQQEKAEITYTVVGPESVLFMEGDQTTKSTQRLESLARGTATLEHRLRLVEASTKDPAVSVEIGVLLKDESGGRQKRTLVLAV